MNTQTQHETETATSSARRKPGFAIAVLALAQLIISVDYNIVYVALPRIGGDLGFSDQHLQWVVSVYAVAFGGLLLLGGRAGDLFGKRRMFLLGLALYAISSLVGGLAVSPAMLLTGRALQGVGGAFLFPATLALIYASFGEGAVRNRALSVWAAAGAGGMVVGSLLGGVLTEWFGWEAVFLVNIPIALVAILIGTSALPADSGEKPAGGLDIVGGVTATAAVTLIVFGLVQGPDAGWTSNSTLAPLLIGLLLVPTFLIVEARTAAPLMPLRLFANRNLSVGVSVTLLFMATFGTLLYFVTIYYQVVLRLTPLETGLALLPAMFCGFAGSLLGGRVATKFGVRLTMVAALLVGGLATLTFGATVQAGGSYLLGLPGFLVLSVCQGVVFTTMYVAAGMGLSWQDQGIGAGIVSTGQQVGSALGMAVLVSLANVVTANAGDGSSTRAALAEGLRTGIFAIVGGIILCALIALLFQKPARQPG